MTYLGGSAGDLFAASANGIATDLQNNQHLGGANVSFSMKKWEQDIVSQKTSLHKVLSTISWPVVSTHLYEPLNDVDLPVISLVVTDSKTVETVVLRQMQFQTLSVRRNSGNFYDLLIDLVKKSRWTDAADLWLTMASNKWRRDMKHRLDNIIPGSRVFYFDKLFQKDFVDDVVSQGWTDWGAFLRFNHDNWLPRNQGFSKDKTLESMSQKIKSMSWFDQKEFVSYESVT